MELRGKAALVTGAARRVGREIALALARKGCHVALHYNRSRGEAAELAAELKEEHGVRAEPFRADLGRHREVLALAGSVESRFGPIDLLVNSASVYERRELAAVDEAYWDQNLDVNLKAPFFLAQRLGLAMKKRGAGKVVNIADWAGLRPYAGYSAYCVSKAGLIYATQALAKGLGPQVQVNAVLPGPVLLPEGLGPKERQAIVQATLVKRLGTPRDVANAVVFLAENDFVTGASLPVDGGRLAA